MPSAILKPTRSDTSPISRRIEPVSDVGSDQWMLDRGFVPMTPAEAKAHAHLFECAGTAPRVKIICLVEALQKALRNVFFHGSAADRDTNKEALEQVEKATDSEPVSGEELLESEELKRQLREAKQRELPPPAGT